MVEWLCEKLGRVCTPHMVCIGNEVGGELVGVIGFDEWNGASCQMHMAGTGNWVTREFIRIVFGYVFLQEKLRKVIGIIPSSNTKSIRFAQHVGFTIEHVIEDAHLDGALTVLSMRPQECRFIRQRNRHGIESQSTCSA